MIEIENVSKSFGKQQVLKKVNLNCRAGECIALIGPNACGKTTLIKSILGMVLPDSGNISFDGKSILGQFAYRNEIGYMPQIGRYPDNMTIGRVIETIRTVRNFKGETDEELIRHYKIGELSGKRMHTLSGGTRQKVSATLAFLFNPKVLILDEPTAGLDPLAAEILKEKIKTEKAKGKLIIITSHLLAELDELITQVAFMQEGHVRFLKTVEELRAEAGGERISRAIAGLLKQMEA